MPEDLKKSDRADQNRPVPSQAEGDEETVDKSLAQKDNKEKKGE